MFDFNTNKPQRFFFFGRIPDVLERCRSSWRPWIISPHVIRITASGIFRLWNPKSRTLESEIQLKESGIQVPLTGNLESSSGVGRGGEGEGGLSSYSMHGRHRALIHRIQFPNVARRVSPTGR